MILKSHLCGIAVAYDSKETGSQEDKKTQAGFYDNGLKNVRPQGSLYSQQKRKIADACEWMRLNATYKPIIFVATSPGFTNHANESKLISKFTHNIRNGYSCKNYVWVREFTQAGFPHFHFVADMPDFDCVSLSKYWSSLFDSTANNSIRLGTAPRNGKRQYYLKGKRMSWYLTKYLGKAIGDCEKSALGFRKGFRTFAVSQELTKASGPKIYESKMVRTGPRQAYTTSGATIDIGQDERHWIDENSEIQTDEDLLKNWNWKFTGFANTFKGYPKEWKLK